MSAHIKSNPTKPRNAFGKGCWGSRNAVDSLRKGEQGIPPAVAHFAVFRTNKVFSGPNGARDNLLYNCRKWNDWYDRCQPS